MKRLPSNFTIVTEDPTPGPNETYRNGGVVSVSPSKKFALVMLEGMTCSAYITNPEWSISRGNVVVVSLSEEREPQIVSCYPINGPIPAGDLPPEPFDYDR
jgi:hypothetical protein